MQEMQVHSLGQEDPLEEGLATHSSILAWRISWTEEPDRLQSMGWQRVGHGWVPFTSHGAHTIFLLVIVGWGITRFQWWFHVLNSPLIYPPCPSPQTCPLHLELYCSLWTGLSTSALDRPVIFHVVPRYPAFNLINMMLICEPIYSCERGGTF